MCAAMEWLCQGHAQESIDVSKPLMYQVMGLCHVLEGRPTPPLHPLLILVGSDGDIFAKKGVLPFSIHPNGQFIPGIVLGKDMRPLEFKNKRRSLRF